MIKTFVFQKSIEAGRAEAGAYPRRAGALSGIDRLRPK
jgi:hypothetical protein